jgi:hypothetical protein
VREQVARSAFTQHSRVSGGSKNRHVPSSPTTVTAAAASHPHSAAAQPLTGIQHLKSRDQPASSAQSSAQRAASSVALSSVSPSDVLEGRCVLHSRAFFLERLRARLYLPFFCAATATCLPAHPAQTTPALQQHLHRANCLKASQSPILLQHMLLSMLSMYQSILTRLPRRQNFAPRAARQRNRVLRRATCCWYLTRVTWHLALFRSERAPNVKEQRPLRAHLQQNRRLCPPCRPAPHQLPVRTLPLYQSLLALQNP